MIRILTTVAVATVLLASNRAQADQCWAMPLEQSKKADARLAQLEPGDVILFFCEPCGMKKPERVVMYTVKDGNVSGHSLDAAYVFVPEGSQTSGARKFVNLAKIAGCPTSGCVAERDCRSFDPEGVGRRAQTGAGSRRRVGPR